MSTDDQPFQTYDPAKLIDEVSDLLRTRGLFPAFPDGRSVDATIGASMLLRGLGVFPATPAEDAYARSTDLVWGENQDVR